MRKLILLACLFLFPAHALAANSSPISVETRVGLDGFYRVGEWVPVTVTISNLGPPVDLQVGVPLDPQPGVWTHVRMASPSRKRIRLYVPLRGYDLIRKLEETRYVGKTAITVEVYAGRSLIARHQDPYQPNGREVYAFAIVGQPEMAPTMFANRPLLISMPTIEEPAPSPPRSPPKNLTLRGPGGRAVPLPVPGAGTAPFSGMPQPDTAIPAIPPPVYAGAGMQPGLPPPPSAPEVRPLQPRMLSLTVEDLPDHPVGLETCDCIAMSPATLRSLNAAQRDALLTWTERGGVLLLFHGAPADVNHESVQVFAPVRAADIRFVDRLPEMVRWLEAGRARLKNLKQFEFNYGAPYSPASLSAKEPITTPIGPFMMNDVDPKAGTEVAFKDGMIPLLVTQRRGFGGVGYCNLNLSSDQIRGWSGGADLWLATMGALVERLQKNRASDIGVRGTAPSHFASANISDDPNVSSFLRKLRGVKAPATWAVAAIAIAYLFVFGPLNVWLIRRIRRSERGWLMTPALSAGFALFLLLCGFHWGGGRSVVTQLSVLECMQGSRTAHEEVVWSLFTPIYGRFNFRFEEPAIFVEDKTAEEEEKTNDTQQPFGRPQPFAAMISVTADKFAPLADAGLVLQQATSSLWQDVAMSVWTLRRFHAMRSTSLGGGVAMSVGPDLNGKIENRTPYLLLQCMLVSGRRQCRIGNLPPGESKSVRASEWSEPASGSFSPMGRTEDWKALYDRMPLTVMPRNDVVMFARADSAALKLDPGRDVKLTSYGVLVVRANFFKR